MGREVISKSDVATLRETSSGTCCVEAQAGAVAAAQALVPDVTERSPREDSEMCDTVAGELILCFTTIDLAARNLVALIRDHKIGHVEYVDSLDNKLAKLNLKPDPDLEFDLHLVRVPSGQESWKTTYLHFFYNHELLKAIPSSAQRFTKVLGRSDYQFTVSPNHLLTVAGSSPPGTPSRRRTFSLARTIGVQADYRSAPSFGS
jgi:hypothetical protein